MQEMEKKNMGQGAIGQLIGHRKTSIVTHTVGVIVVR